MTWSYCAQTVKDLDSTRFLITLNLPKEQREPSFALLAFNCEIAKTASVVTQEMLGHIRFQWWREAVDEVYDANGDQSKVRHHEVLKALVSLSNTLPKHLLHLIIDAHVNDLSEQPFSNIDKLENYSAETGGTLLRLQGMLSIKEKNDGLDRQLNHLGAAWTLTEFALYETKSKLIPTNTTTEEIVELAYEHLDRVLHSDFLKSNQLVALNTKVVSLRLKALSQASFIPSQAMINRLSANLPLKLWWTSLKH